MADEIIKSRANAVVKRFRMSRERGRSGEAVMLVEGPKLLGEALAAGVAVLEVAATPRALRSPASAEVVSEAASRGAGIRRVDEAVLASLSEAETSQGVLALARRPAFEEEQLFARTPLLVVGVAIQNPGNVGALLRSAEAAGATGAYLTAGTADAFSWKALRGSMGSAFRLPHVSGIGTAVAISRLRRRGVRVVAASADGASSHGEADLTGPVAFLLGNEGAGLPPDVVAAADARIRIPMHGRVESLNVAVAGAVLLYEAARQRGILR